MNSLDRNKGVRTFEIKIPQSNAFLLMPKSSIGTIDASASIRQAVEKMKHNGYTSIPVLTDSGEYYGTITEGDFLWYFVNEESIDFRNMKDVIVADIVRPTWNPPIKLDESLETVLERVLNQNFIPVVDDRNMFMGIITRKSVLKYYHDMMNHGKSV